METRAAEFYPAEPADDITAEPVAGRYRVRARIGRGRLGDIYEAEDVRHRELGVERAVAVQLLPDSLAFDDSRFAGLKAGYAGLLVKSHPGIVEYHDIGRDTRFGYIVMERLEGASLRTVLDYDSPLPLSDVAPVMSAVGNALEFLHGRSITHGAVSAENVFVTDDLEFRLLDVVPIPEAGSDPGRPTEAGIADDLYDLACLAYELLSGRHPYNFHSRAHAARSGRAPNRIDSLPERQWLALERALTFDSERRPRTIAGFLADFGLSGNERLRPSETPAPAPAREAPGASQPLPRPETRELPLRAERDPRRAKQPNETGSLLLLLVLIALGTWFGTREPQADVVALLEALDPPIAAPREPVPLPETPAATPGEPAAGDDEAGTAETSEVAESDDEATDSGVTVTTTPASAPSAAEAPSPRDDERDGALTDDLSSASADPAESPAAAGTPEFEAAFVTVSERDVAARILVRLPEAPTTRFYWWTRPHGALPEQDYVSAGVQPLRAGEPGQPSTILVSLVNDGRPEPVEDFFVHVGEPDADGRFVPLDTIRIDIADDD